MPKKLEDEKLPPSYINLGYDAEPVPGPSAPVINEVNGDYAAASESVAGPSAPIKEADSYEDFKPAPVPAPSPSAPTLPVTPTPRYLTCSYPALAFEDVYEACMKYVKDHCCYSSRPIRQMKLTDINNGCAFHYVLETFAEKRESASRYCAYKGGAIDGPQNGPPPDPWDMFVRLPEMFKDSSTVRDIPHTEYVTTCGKCDGSGEVTCHWCSGSGTTSCSRCSGRGRDDEDNRCSSCSGSGTERCWKCSGSGRIECSRCDGYGKLKNYRVLIVTWTNHKQDFISEIHKLPQDKIRKAEGDLLFTETEEKVLPIANAPDVSVNIASTRMVEAHRIGFPTELIRQQRQHLRAVPFTTVQYQWKETTGEFYVYGKFKDVYFEDYPQKCCCCICC